MVKSSSQDRIEAYEDKRESMAKNYAKRVVEKRPKLERLGARAEVDSKVASILTANNITATDRIKYHNFARAIEKRVREGTLTSDFIEAEKAKFIALGCEESVLDQIVEALRGQA